MSTNPIPIFRNEHNFEQWITEIHDIKQLYAEGRRNVERNSKYRNHNREMICKLCGIIVDSQFKLMCNHITSTKAKNPCKGLWCQRRKQVIIDQVKRIGFWNLHFRQYGTRRKRELVEEAIQVENIDGKGAAIAHFEMRKNMKQEGESDEARAPPGDNMPAEKLYVRGALRLDDDRALQDILNSLTGSSPLQNSLSAGDDPSNETLSRRGGTSSYLKPRPQNSAGEEELTRRVDNQQTFERQNVQGVLAASSIVRSADVTSRATDKDISDPAHTQRLSEEAAPFAPPQSALTTFMQIVLESIEMLMDKVSRIENFLIGEQYNRHL